MATLLGSTAQPTSVLHFDADNNQFAIALTLPAGGPWKIVDLGAWLAGYNNVSAYPTYLCIWTAGGALLGKSAAFTAAGRPFTVRQSDSYQYAPATAVVVNGGTTVWVGFTADPADTLEFDVNAAGSTYQKNVTTGYPGSMSGYSTYSNKAGAWLHYQLNNNAPTTPTLTAPTDLAIVAGVTPVLAFTGHDVDAGDYISKYDIQVSTDSTFASITHWNDTNDSNNITNSQYVNRTYAGSSLARGTRYYWRARTYDTSSVVSPWSATKSFYLNQLPTAAAVTPLTGQVAALSYTTASGWASPRPTVTWTFTDANAAHAQTAYQVIVYNDSAGSPGTTLYDSGKVVSTVQTLLIPATFVEGSYYHWKVQVWDTLDEASAAYSATQRFRTRWGSARFRADLGAVPTSWAIDTLSVSGSGALVVEYNSADDTADTNLSATWQTSLATVTKRRWFTYRVWLLPTGNVATGLTASLDKLVLTYSTLALAPDKWTLASGAIIETGVQVYGTQSLRMNGNGTELRTYQTVTVLPNTNYQLSGRIKSNGQSLAYLGIENANGTIYVLTPQVQATQEFGTTDLTVAWNSGSKTTVQIVCAMTGLAGTTAWFDAIKFESAFTPTPWTPAFVGPGAVVEATGVQIDAASGGVLRLLGSAGGTRDRVDLAASGLTFGGDVPVTSPTTGVLSVGGALALTGGITGTNPIVRVYTAGATWTKPAASLGLQFVVIEVVGGGGGGGGAAISATGTGASGGGGGGGGYARAQVAVATMGATETVTVGAGGTGGVGGGATATAGGSSSVGTKAVATSGAGGGNSGATGGGAIAAGGLAGNGTTGDIVASGGDGGNGATVSGGIGAFGNYGGSTILGGSSRGPSSSANGQAGRQYGGGGAGSVNITTSGSANRTGGAGAAGVVIITEHYAP